MSEKFGCLLWAFKDVIVQQIRKERMEQGNCPGRGNSTEGVWVVCRRNSGQLN